MPLCRSERDQLNRVNGYRPIIVAENRWKLDTRDASRALSPPDLQIRRRSRESVSFLAA